MSIYSGFATRQQQQIYDETVGSLLHLMQKRICKFYFNEQIDQNKFSNLVIKMFASLKKMEISKYLQPKMSNFMAELVQLVKNKQVQSSAQAQNLKHQKSQVKNIDDQNITNKLKQQVTRKQILIAPQISMITQTAKNKSDILQHNNKIINRSIADKNTDTNLSLLSHNIARRSHNKNDAKQSKIQQINLSPLATEKESISKNILTPNEQKIEPDGSKHQFYTATPKIKQFQVQKLQNNKIYSFSSNTKQRRASTFIQLKQQKSSIAQNTASKGYLSKQKGENTSGQQIKTNKQYQSKSQINNIRANYNKIQQLQKGNRESKSQVRQLIKYYLIKKRKNLDNHQSSKRMQVNQFFKDL